MYPTTVVLSGLVLIPTYALLRFLYRLLIGWRLSPLRQRRRRRRSGDAADGDAVHVVGVPGVPPPSRLFGHQAEILREPFMGPPTKWFEALSAEAAKRGEPRPKMMLYYTSGMRESLMLVHPDAARALLRRGRRKVGETSSTSLGSMTARMGGSAPAAADAEAAGGMPKRLPLLKSYIGNGLVTLNGAEWHRHRTIIQPAFATHFVRTLMESAVPPLAENMCRAWERLPRGTPISLQDHLQSVTLDVIGRAGFGHEFGLTEELLRWAELVRELRSSASGAGAAVGGGKCRWADLPPREAQVHPIASAFSNEGMHVIRPTLLELALGTWYARLAAAVLPRSRPWTRARVVRRTNEAIEEIIREQRERCRQSEKKLTAYIKRRSSDWTSDGSEHKKTVNGTAVGAMTGNGGRGNGSGSTTRLSGGEVDVKIGKSVRKTPRSILEILISEFSSLTDAELRDEVKTFIFAGAETTSTAVNLSVFAMCTLPEERGNEVQTKLREDVCTHWPDQSKPPTADMLNRMEYLHAVLREGMRLYPPVGMIFRIADKHLDDFVGAEVPRGTRLVLSIYLLHRNPVVWGSRAEEFIPERWLSDPATRAAVPGGGVDAAPDDPFAFVPFSAGGRQCIGKVFAMLEAKILMATIVRRFKFRLAKELTGEEFTISSFVTMSPKPYFLTEVEPWKD